MKIDGKAIAETIFTDLTKQVAILKQKNITPTLAVILVGDNPESLSYIRQKQKATEKIGGRFIFEQIPKASLSKEVTARVEMYNRDPSVHGLIVQRPLPSHFDLSINESVDPKKDVDGFVTNSPFDVPIVMAIFTILKHIGITLNNKKIVIVGRGETAGKPIAAALAKRQCATSIIYSKTSNPNEIMKDADVIISCVGKQGVVTGDALKSGAILISVGIWRAEDGKLHGDYEEDDVADIASFYTPTPGGVGPLNIASLMQNLVKAAQNTR
ncbi:MAG: bifunctional 5,10-methylenetetrahydrofolate dehydrogenase/5,10-methenyltetrahydrofolate cyclohydrolase [Candidatus Gottesmanbacteria bacterium]|nr:bifunctional 5,10-methylenetetrahydrofolate dehydrogenase/5,10-methenyltetrahydrofolate cyclohydrolase [Candidatus Gottesmanbacteria bacterium]